MKLGSSDVPTVPVTRFISNPPISKLTSGDILEKNHLRAHGQTVLGSFPEVMNSDVITALTLEINHTSA